MNPIPCFVDSLKDGFYVRTETHIQEAVTFIQDKVFDTREINVIFVGVDEALNGG